jgi:hypothetical protein
VWMLFFSRISSPTRSRGPAQWRPASGRVARFPRVHLLLLRQLPNFLCSGQVAVSFRSSSFSSSSSSSSSSPCHLLFFSGQVACLFSTVLCFLFPSTSSSSLPPAPARRHLLFFHRIAVLCFLLFFFRVSATDRHLLLHCDVLSPSSFFPSLRCRVLFVSFLVLFSLWLCSTLSVEFRSCNLFLLVSFRSLLLLLLLLLLPLFVSIRTSAHNQIQRSGAPCRG